MKVNGKNDIPYIYMKWKIKFMFQTTNQFFNVHPPNMSGCKRTSCLFQLDLFQPRKARRCGKGAGPRVAARSSNVARPQPGLLWLCQQFAIENGDFPIENGDLMGFYWEIKGY